tara:strand:- start:9775 stop:9963 length:189 start_codon:yes stop_codon:yes gene_type:complete
MHSDGPSRNHPLTIFVLENAAKKRVPMGPDLKLKLQLKSGKSPVEMNHPRNHKDLDVTRRFK